MSSDLIKSVVRAAVPRPVRNWLRSPSKSAKWLWDSTAFSWGATRRLPLLPDWSIICHPTAFKVIQQAQVADPEQSAEFLNFLSYCAAKMLLFDIGAHFGVFSVAAAHYGGRAIAVDPSPTATQMIATQAALNGCAKDIQIVQAAVSDTDGVIAMLNSGVFSDGYFQVVKGRAKGDLSQVRAITLDQITFQYGAPTHIKVDVEGYEASVIRGARETLGQCSPLLFLELHNEIVVREGGDPNKVLDELAELGYIAFAMDGEKARRDSILSRPIARIVAKRDSP